MLSRRLRAPSAALVVWLGLAGARAETAAPDQELGRSAAEVAPGVKVTEVGKGSEDSHLTRADVVVFGRRAAKAKYTFHADRLYDITFDLDPNEDFARLAATLNERYGEPWRLEEDTKAKIKTREASWRWRKVSVLLTQEAASRTTLSVWDFSQKDFRWSDLLKGAGLMALLVFLGMVAVYVLVVGAITSWCAHCKSFKMSTIGRSVTGYTDVSPTPFERDYRENVTYRYRCKRCGYSKTDRFGGIFTKK